MIYWYWDKLLLFCSSHWHWSILYLYFRTYSIPSYVLHSVHSQESSEEDLLKQCCMQNMYKRECYASMVQKVGTTFLFLSLLFNCCPISLVSMPFSHPYSPSAGMVAKDSKKSSTTEKTWIIQKKRTTNRMIPIDTTAQKMERTIHGSGHGGSWGEGGIAAPLFGFLSKHWNVFSVPCLLFWHVALAPHDHMQGPGAQAARLQKRLYWLWYRDWLMKWMDEWLRWEAERHAYRHLQTDQQTDG